MKAAFLALLVGLSGCLATLPERPQVFFMQPLTLNAWQGEAPKGDPLSLFREGSEFFDQGLWREALLRYQALIKQEPEDSLYYPAVFNAGLSLTRLGDYGQAITAFAAVADGRDSALRSRALWNLLDLQERQKQWGAALQTTDKLLPLVKKVEERTELEGDQQLLEAWRDSDGDPEKVLDAGDHWLVQARRRGPVPRMPRFLKAFLAGVGYAAKMSPETLSARLYFGSNVTDSLTLALPVLEKEAQLLMAAQRWFLQAVRISDNEWAGAAVFEIGELYRRFYHGLLGLPMPEGLDKKELEVYQQELTSRIEPVREKAQLAYERILRFSRQQGVVTPWMLQAQSSLAQMKAFDPLAAWSSSSSPRLP